jgi:hypothetical protein
MEPQVFTVKPEQVGNEDVSQFLNKAIAREFSDGEYFIVNETTIDTIHPQTMKKRKVRAFCIEARGRTQTIYFDITEVSAARASTNSWGL